MTSVAVLIGTCFLLILVCGLVGALKPHQRVLLGGGLAVLLIVYVIVAATFALLSPRNLADPQDVHYSSDRMIR